MDDHVALYFIVGRDGGENTQHIFFKCIEKISHDVIGASRDRGIKILYDDLIFQIQRGGRIQHKASGRIDDPENGVRVGVQRVQLYLDGFQRYLVFVQVGSVGIGDESSLAVEGFRMLLFQMIQRHVGHKSSHHHKAKQAENNICQY